jgi:flagellar basal body-associated protein FliL
MFNSKLTEKKVIVIITVICVLLLVLPVIGIFAWLVVNGRVGETLRFDGKWLP